MEPALPTWSLAGALRGARLVVPLLISSFVFGLVTGAAARGAGLSLLEATLMSALVFGGTAQMVALQGWTTPVPVLPIVLTTFAVNSRLIPMSAALRPWFRHYPRATAYGTLMLLVDINWAFAMREQAAGRRDGAFILGSGLALYVNWVASTALGHEMGGRVADIRAWGIDFIVPAFCAAMLAGVVRRRHDLTPCLVGGAVAAAMALLVPGHWHVLVGGLAGSLVGLAQRDD